MFSSCAMDNLTYLERSQYACSVSSKEIPPTASCLYRKNLKYRQQLTKKKELGDMSMNSLSFDISSVKELMKSPLAKFIAFSANDCGYRRRAKDLMVNWAHPLFLKSKATASKEDNPTWKEAIHGPFAG